MSLAFNHQRLVGAHSQPVSPSSSLMEPEEDGPASHSFLPSAWPLPCLLEGFLRHWELAGLQAANLGNSKLLLSLGAINEWRTRVSPWSCHLLPSCAGSEGVGHSFSGSPVRGRATDVPTSETGHLFCLSLPSAVPPSCVCLSPLLKEMTCSRPSEGTQNLSSTHLKLPMGGSNRKTD